MEKVDELLAYFMTKKKLSSERSENRTRLLNRYDAALKALDISSLKVALDEAKASGMELFSEDSMSVALLFEDAKKVAIIREARETFANRLEELERNPSIGTERIPVMDDVLSRITETLGELAADAKSLYTDLGEPPTDSSNAMTIAALKERERGHLEVLIKRRDVRWSDLATLLRGKAIEAANVSNLKETDRLAVSLEEWAKMDGRPESVASAASAAREAHNDAKDKKAQELMDRAMSLLARADGRQNLVPTYRINLLAEALDYLNEANEMKPEAVSPPLITQVEAKINMQGARLWLRAKDMLDARRRTKLDALICKWHNAKSEDERRNLFQRFHKAFLGVELSAPFMAEYGNWLKAQKALQDARSEAIHLITQSDAALPSDLKQVDASFIRARVLYTQLSDARSPEDTANILPKLAELQQKLILIATSKVNELVHQVKDRLRDHDTTDSNLAQAKELLTEQLEPLQCVGEDLRSAISEVRQEIEKVAALMVPRSAEGNAFVEHLDDVLQCVRKGFDCVPKRNALQNESLWFPQGLPKMPPQQYAELAQRLDELAAIYWDEREPSFKVFLIGWQEKLRTHQNQGIPNTNSSTARKGA